MDLTPARPQDGSEDADRLTDPSDVDPAFERAARLRWTAPDNEVPGRLGEPTVVAADADAAVVLAAVWHYSAGLVLSLEFRRRVDGDDWQRFPDDTFIGVELADGTKVV